MKDGKSCDFDYKTIYKDTPCTEENQFGYNTAKPCVLIKLNKIIDFVPSGSLEIKCYLDVIMLFLCKTNWSYSIFNLLNTFLIREVLTSKILKVLLIIQKLVKVKIRLQ